MVGELLPLVRLKGAAGHAASELQSGLPRAMQASLVQTELLVCDEVHVTPGAAVLSLLRRQVRLPHVGLPVCQREEGEVTARALGQDINLDGHA